MQKHPSNTQKSGNRKQSFTDQNRTFDERFSSLKSKKSVTVHHNTDDSKASVKESYNGGSTYGEHQ